MICRTLAALMVPLLDGWRPPSAGFVDSGSHPIRCHWELERDAPRCEIVLRAAERSWDVQVDALGFEAPMPDDDGILDIYLSDDQTGGGAYAYGPSVDEDPDDGKRGCHAYIGIDPSVGDDVLAAYVAHEFSHVLQYATDFTEPTLPLWEGTAHAAEAWTLPGHELDAGNVADFQRTPWMGLLGDGYFLLDAYDLWSYYEYGAVAWILYLDHEHGSGDGSAVAALWRAASQPGPRNEPDVLDAFEEVAGDDALMAFSAARVAFGTDAAPAWTEALGAMAQLGLEAEVVVGEEPLALTPTVAPYQTGASYWRLLGVPEGATLHLEVEASGASFGVLAADDAAVDWAIDDTLEWVGTSEVVVGAVNLGEPGFDGDDAWRQTAFTLHVWVEEPDPTDGETDGPGIGAADDGCACSTRGSGHAAWLLALVLLRIRRRRGAAATVRGR
ncbi:MAG: hypothetical protein ACE37F_32285 [Nannocystaceae bacterium]|nr:hypothetical protein [bacterium]